MLVLLQLQRGGKNVFPAEFQPGLHNTIFYGSAKAYGSTGNSDAAMESIESPLKISVVIGELARVFHISSGIANSQDTGVNHCAWRPLPLYLARVKLVRKLSRSIPVDKKHWGFWRRRQSVHKLADAHPKVSQG